MTSSLVGSEMCIRDSLGADRRCKRTRPKGGYRKDKQRLRQAKWNSLLAVSYTHLTLPTICSV
eukprot:7076603-Prorocentrum_lima.AAC.1